jgi:hypothetical protein
MNDVCYRINNVGTVKKFGTMIVNNGGGGGLQFTPNASGSTYYRDQQWSLPTEQPGGTGLVNRFDDPTYYTS